MSVHRTSQSKSSRFDSPSAKETESAGAPSETRLSVICRAKGGDAREFALIYGPLAFRMARRWGLGTDDAEDVMQQTLFELLKMLPRFEYDPKRGRFKGLVKTIVRHRSVDLARRRARATEDEVSEDAVDPNQDLDDQFERDWQRAHLERALDRVKGEVKDSTFRSFESRYVEGLPVEQVATLLSQSKNQVAQNCRRVIQRLRDHMKGLLDDEF